MAVLHGRFVYMLHCTNQILPAHQRFCDSGGFRFPRCGQALCAFSGPAPVYTACLSMSIVLRVYVRAVNVRSQGLFRSGFLAPVPSVVQVVKALVPLADAVPGPQINSRTPEPIIPGDRPTSPSREELEVRSLQYGTASSVQHAHPLCTGGDGTHRALAPRQMDVRRGNVREPPHRRVPGAAGLASKQTGTPVTTTARAPPLLSGSVCSV